MEITVFTSFCYPGTLMHLCILVLLYVFTLVYKINQNLFLNIRFSYHINKQLN